MNFGRVWKGSGRVLSGIVSIKSMTWLKTLPLFQYPFHKDIENRVNTGMGRGRGGIYIYNNTILLILLYKIDLEPFQNPSKNPPIPFQNPSNLIRKGTHNAKTQNP